MPQRRLHKLFTPLLAAGLLVPAATADAQRPAGDWTKLQDDGFVHWACKDNRTKKGGWTVRIRSVAGPKYDNMDGFGIFAAVVRGGRDDNFADEVSVKPEDRRGDVITIRLRGARNGDRIWSQTAAYGPPQAWRKGTPVRSITRCD